MLRSWGARMVVHCIWWFPLHCHLFEIIDVVSVDVFNGLIVSPVMIFFCRERLGRVCVHPVIVVPIVHLFYFLVPRINVLYSAVAFLVLTLLLLGASGHWLSGWWELDVFLLPLVRLAVIDVIIVRRVVEVFVEMVEHYGRESGGGRLYGGDGVFRKFLFFVTSTVAYQSYNEECP